VKLKIAGIKIKISWKHSRLAKSISNFFKGPSYTLKDLKPVHPELMRERKIYRLFKEKYCEFQPGKTYGMHGTEPSSMIYYKGCSNLGCNQYLIGELMFGEDKENFFKRKNILIQEDIKEYRIVQDELVLAKFDKEWVETQGQYQ
jgi:hypothetical protein